MCRFLGLLLVLSPVFFANVLADHGGEKLDCSETLFDSSQKLFETFFPKAQVKAQDWYWAESDRLILYKHKKDILVWSKKDKAVVGILGYSREYNSFRIALNDFDPRFLGQGFAFESKYFGMLKGFEDPHINVVPALISISNKASLALHKKLGFKRSPKAGIAWYLKRSAFNKTVKKINKGSLSFISQSLIKTQPKVGLFIDTLGHHFDSYEVHRVASDFLLDLDSFLPNYLEHSVSETAQVFFNRLSRDSCFLDQQFVFIYSNRCISKILSYLLLTEPYLDKLGYYDDLFAERARVLLASIRKNKYKNVTVEFFDRRYSVTGFREAQKKDLELLQDLKLKSY